MATRALAEIVIDFIPLPGGATIWKVLVSVHDLCEEVGEAKGTCLELRERLQSIFHEMEGIKASRLLNNQAIPKFTKVLSEYWHELDAYKNRTTVDRFFHHRKMKKVIASINEELDHLVTLVGLASAGALVDWRRQYDIDMPAQQQQLLDVLRNGTELLDELRGIRERLDATVLLKAEVDKINRGESDLDDEAQAAVRTALTAIVGRSNVHVEPTPAWFVPEADVAFDETPFARGMFASVHRGTLNVHTRVVVKMLLPDEGGLDASLQKALVDEANLWYSLCHPNVVQMLGGCHVSQRPFIVSKEATNGSMKEFLDKNPGQRQQLWRLLYETAMGLRYLHGKSIVHGDVRLSNILVAQDLTAQLTDFGLTRMKDQSKSMTQLKASGGLDPILRWKAPEEHTHKAQFKSDVYRLAMSIVEAYTGQPPYAEVHDLGEVKAKILNGELPARPAGMTERVWQLIVDMTKTDMNERISIDEAVNRLSELVDNEPAPSSSVVINPEFLPQSTVPSVNVQKLLKELEVVSDQDKAAVAVRLSALTGKPDSAQQFQSASIIRVLVNELEDSSNPMVKQHLAHTLANIAQDPEGARLIGSRGGVPPLVDLLSEKDAQLRHSGMRALTQVVNDPMNGAMFVQSNGIKGVEDHLRSSASNEYKEVLEQLGVIFSSCDEAAHAAASSKEIVDACLGHLKSRHADERDAAGRVLREIVRCQAAVHELHGDSRISALIDLVKDQNRHAEGTLKEALDTLVHGSTASTQPDEHGADDHTSPTIASIDGDHSVVDRIPATLKKDLATLAQAVNTQSQQGESAIFSIDDYTPLMVASMNGDFNTVGRLLMALKKDPATLGRAVNAQNLRGESALFLASQHDHRDIVRLLLRHGARTDVVLLTGDTAHDASLPRPVRAILLDWNNHWGKYQQFCDLVVKTITASRVSPTKATVDLLVSSITSSYDLSSVLTLLALPGHSFPADLARLLIVSTLEHVVESRLLFDEGCVAFYRTTLRYCVKTHLQDSSDMINLSARVRLQNDEPSVRLDLKYVEKFVEIFNEACSLLREQRNAIVSQSQRVNTLRSEVNVAWTILQCLDARRQSVGHPSLHNLEQRLHRVQSNINDGVFDVDRLRLQSESEQNAGYARRVVAAVASFVFPSRLQEIAPTLVQFADPIDIVAHIYKEADVALFLAGKSTKELPLCIKTGLDQHFIPLAEFESLLREAVASTHPQYIQECALRDFPLEIVGGSFEAVSALIPELEREETEMSDLLCDMLAALEASSSYRGSRSIERNGPDVGDTVEVADEAEGVCKDSIHQQQNDASTPSARDRFSGMLRGFRQRLSARVAPSGSSIGDQTRNASELTTYVNALINSVSELEPERYCKVCVLGPGSRHFVRCLTGHVPRTGSGSDIGDRDGVRPDVFDWSYEVKDDPEDDVVRKYHVTLWTYPDSKECEPVSAQCCSEAALYLVCTDFEPYAFEFDQLHWVRLIRARDPGGQIIVVDTAQTTPDAGRAVSSSFRLACEKLRFDYLAAVDEDLRRVSALDAPNVQLRQLSNQLKQLHSQTLPVRYVQMNSNTMEKDIKNSISASRRVFAISNLQLEVMDALRTLGGDDTRTDNAPDRSIMTAFTERRTLCARLKTRCPSVDEATFDATLQILHSLGEVFCFDNIATGRLNGFVCTNVHLWLSVLFEAMRVSSGLDGNLVHDAIKTFSAWFALGDAKSTKWAKELLTTSLLAFPSCSELRWDSDLVVPTNLPPPDDWMTSTPLELPDPQPDVQSFSWIRKFVFQQAPPDCLFSHMIVACHNEMRGIKYPHQATRQRPEHDRMRNNPHELPFQAKCNRDCLECVFGKDLVIRLSMVRVAQAAGAKVTTQLEVLGAQQQPLHRQIFQAVAGAVEVVLDMYPGLWVTREDATWMPTEWALEDMARHIERRPRVREALVIDDNLYVDKICIIGPRHSGKTTLTKSLTSNTPSLKHPKNRTARIDLAEGSFLEKDSSKAFARRHAVTICDFAGSAKYQAAHTLFFPYASIFLVCVDLHAYAMALEQAQFIADDEPSEEKLMTRFVSQNVLRWIDKIFFANNDVIPVLVATKSDIVRHDAARIDRIRVHLFEKLKTHAKKHVGENREKLDRLLPVTSVARRSKTSSSTWLAVSCVSQASVADAQQRVEEAIVSAKRSVLLPNVYARAFTSIMTLRETISYRDPEERIASTIMKSKELSSWLQKAVPTLEKSIRENVLLFMHSVGDIVRYRDFRVRELQADKVILEPRLVIDFAREIFSHKSLGETLTHIDLENGQLFPLWASIAEKPEKFELKLILRALRIVRQTQGEMEEDSDLLVPAYTKRLITYGNAHVGPLYRRYVRSPSSTHEFHVLWKFYLGKILDERFFEWLVEHSYSEHEMRVVYNGLIKYTADDTADGETCGKTERQFCQVWIDQMDRDGRYIVCVEAVAGSADQSQVWDPFGRTCVAIEKALKECFHKTPCLLYAVQVIRDGLRVEEREHKVKEAITRLWSGPSSHRTSTWMPPRLTWYCEKLQLLRNPSNSADDRVDN